MKRIISVCSIVLLLVLTLAVTSFAYTPISWDAAEKIYNSTCSFNHIDVRTVGAITVKTYENGKLVDVSTEYAGELV